MKPDLPFDAAVEAIERADKLVLACHVSPDGDALGSMLGFAASATAAGRRVWASFGRPFRVADNYRFLPLDLLSPPEEVPEDPDVMVVFDVASPDRLGDLARVADHAGKLIVVDHHRSNTGFDGVLLVDPEAAATAEVAVALIDRLGWQLTEEAAVSFYTALVTDTGRFQYSNTGAATLRLAARLVEAGARPHVIGRHLYEEAPFGFLKVAARVLDRARLEGRMVWSVVTADDLEAHGIGWEDTDPLIDLVRVAKEAEVAVLLKVPEPGVVKVSLRSRGGVDVGSIAAALGGGGHHNAAGATVSGSPEQVVAQIGRLHG
ncbi:MAG: phosphoesterase [Acidimicrobiia bacterium]|jgi:phosphoesterase RecJ-like protein|nr:MAG: phosphoesterase [Acidimicrobiia bacterium]